MNRINKIKRLITNGTLFVNVLNRERYKITNSYKIENKGSIIIGMSLLGIGAFSYIQFQENFKFFFRGAFCKVSNSALYNVKLFKSYKPENVLEEQNSEETTEKSNEEIVEKSTGSLIFQTELPANTSLGLPSHVQYLIIGGGIAGMSAARAIRASDPFSKILIINSECQNPGKHKEAHPPYRRILLSKFIWRRSEDNVKALVDSTGDIRSSSMLFIEPDSFFVAPENLNQLEYGGISLLNNTRVASIDPRELSVTLEGSDHKISFKTCLIATGSYPRRLKHLEISSNSGKDLYKDGKISYFRSLNDFRNLSDNIKQLQSKKNGGRILIVGAGLLGTELTTSLSRLAKEQGNLEVIEVFKEKSHLHHLLPEALSIYIRGNVGENNTKLISQSEVVSIEEITDGTTDGQLKVTIKPSPATGYFENIYENVDHVVIAAGVKPDTSLSISANLETDQILGGFLVNTELQARDGIFIAGDVCSFYDPVLGRRRVEHWDHSEESGAIAGHNMAAYVLNTDKDEVLTRIDQSKLANDILKPKIYDFQSSFSFKLSMFKSIDALGLIDSSLETKTFIAQDFFDDINNEEDPSTKNDGATVESVVKTNDPLDMPGVVFYLRNKRIVGIVLWNCDDDIVVDSDMPSPLRTNVARKILSERRVVASDDDLRVLAADFDLSFFINSRMKVAIEGSKEKEEGELQPQKH